MLDFRKLILICLFSISVSFCDNIESKFKKYKVIPDVIRKSPASALYVKYGNGVEPQYGNVLSPAETAQKPGVAWQADPGSFYTLVMVDVDPHPDWIHDGNKTRVIWAPSKKAEDYAPWVLKNPDAPSRKNPIRRNWLHWLVVNVPGKSVAKGTTLASYNGPMPPKDTGAHRYIILVYRQQQKMDFDERFLDSEKSKRGNFNLKKFTSKYNLGEAVAGNFFQAFPLY